jgi:hypothetical protein
MDLPLNAPGGYISERYSSNYSEVYFIGFFIEGNDQYASKKWSNNRAVYSCFLRIVFDSATCAARARKKKIRLKSCFDGALEDSIRWTRKLRELVKTMPSFVPVFFVSEASSQV